MKIKLFSAIMVFVITFAIPIRAEAIELRVPNGMLSISFSNGTAVCSTSCIGNNSNDDVNVTMTLYENGAYVDSWNKSDNGYVSLSEEYDSIIHGKTYRLALTWSINGISQPSVSTEKYYS